MTTRNTFHRMPRITKVLPEWVMSTKVPQMYRGSKGTMATWSTLSMMVEKSLIALYRVSPISFPFMADRDRPRMKASSTAARVSRMGVTEMLNREATELPAVAAICSRAEASMKLGNRVIATRNAQEPAIRVEP